MSEDEFDKEVEDLIKWFKEYNKDFPIENFEEKIEVLSKTIAANKENTPNVVNIIQLLVDAYNYKQKALRRLDDFVKKAETVICKCSPYGTPTSEYMSVRDFLDDDDD